MGVIIQNGIQYGNQPDCYTKIETNALIDGKFPVSLADGGLGVDFSNATGNAGFHNSIYRGKDITEYLTDGSLWDRIAGTNGYTQFEDLFIGDYFNKNGVIWRIAAFNYWLNTGDTSCTTPHVVIVPDTNLATAKMNATNITTGAYVGSDFYTGNNENTGKATAIATVNNAFGAGHILTHREYFTNAVTDGYVSAGALYDSTVDLMNEQMVYGCEVFNNVVHGTALPNSYTIDKSQLPLFRLDHSRICNRVGWWLRSVTSTTTFAFVYTDGTATFTYASNSFGVRPAFAIKA